MPCLFVSLQSAVDCAVWKKRSTSKVIAPWNKRLEQSLQCARSKVPYKWKNSRSPSSQENFIYHVTFWPTVRSMKAVLSLGRNTFLLLVSKTPILKVLARVSFYWQPMTICGKNVDTLRPCKRSNRDFFWLWSTENTHIPSSPVFLYITRGVLRCLLGFLAVWGQKPCGGNYRQNWTTRNPVTN